MDGQEYLLRLKHWAMQDANGPRGNALAGTSELPRNVTTTVNIVPSKSEMGRLTIVSGGGIWRDAEAAQGVGTVA